MDHRADRIFIQSHVFMTNVDYLIIGGGIAGTTAAETIRKLDPNGSIVIVSEEPHHLYSRVLLPHYIRGKIKREFVFLKPLEWYQNHSIVLQNTRMMRQMNRVAHTVTLDDGTEYQYRKLLIATGGRVRRLELPDLRGITYFRTIDDADAILAILAQIDADKAAPKTGVVFGGGFIGLEFAPIFHERGLETHLLIRGHHYWSTVLDEASEAVLVQLFAERDIHLHTAISYVKVEGGAHLEAVDIGGRKIKTRTLGIGVGLTQNLEAVEDAGIEVANGILANEYLETSAPDVYTAGDVAEFFDLTVGRHRMLGNWMNAVQHGITAGKNMTGDRTPFELVSSYSTSPFGVSVTFVGDVSREPETQVIQRYDATHRAAGQIFVRGARVVGATLINMNRARTPITALIKKKVDVRGFAEQLADPEFDLGGLL